MMRTFAKNADGVGLLFIAKYQDIRITNVAALLSAKHCLVLGQNGHKQPEPELIVWKTIRPGDVMSRALGAGALRVDMITRVQ